MEQLNIDKVYYSMGEVSIIIEEEQYTIRKWESKLGLHFHRKDNLKRKFKKSDIDKLKFIKHLVRDEKYTLEGVKQKLTPVKQADTVTA
jgi:DNA-binding transcriptional MerR regulator